MLAEARGAVELVAESLAWGGTFCQCHGIAGNADVLIYAWQALGEERWLAAARAAGDEGAARYERRGVPWSCGAGTPHEVPGLMLGLAGIGYFYLRLADPAIPTVLLAGGADVVA